MDWSKLGEVTDWSELTKMMEASEGGSDSNPVKDDKQSSSPPKNKSNDDGAAASRGTVKPTGPRDMEDNGMSQSKPNQELLEDFSVAGWTDMKQFDDDHDNSWFEEEENRLAEVYGGHFIKVKYTEQGRPGYFCDLCLSEMNAKKSLEAHCVGMKHLKKKALWEKSQEESGANRDGESRRGGGFRDSEPGQSRGSHVRDRGNPDGGCGFFDRDRGSHMRDRSPLRPDGDFHSPSRGRRGRPYDRRGVGSRNNWNGPDFDHGSWDQEEFDGQNRFNDQFNMPPSGERFDKPSRGRFDGPLSRGGFGGPPSRGGFGGPPSRGGFGGPPSRGGFGGPPSRGGFGGPPSRGGFGGPPSRGGFGGPPSRGGFGGPPSGGGFSEPPFRGGFDGPPSRGGFGAPPSRGGFGGPPSRGGFGGPPSRGGFGGPPSRGGFDGPPSRGGFDGPPSRSRFDGPPSGDQFDGPPSADRFDRPPSGDGFEEPLGPKYAAPLADSFQAPGPSHESAAAEKLHEEPPPSKEKLGGGTTGLLLSKLAACYIKDEVDADLALNVVTSLASSLREYNTRKGEKKIAELLMEAELKLNTLKALKVGLKLLVDKKKMTTTTTSTTATVAAAGGGYLPHQAVAPPAPSMRQAWVPPPASQGPTQGHFTSYPPPQPHPRAPSQYPAASSQYPAASSQYPAAASQYPAAASQYPTAPSQYSNPAGQYYSSAPSQYPAARQ